MKKLLLLALLALGCTANIDYITPNLPSEIKFTSVPMTKAIVEDTLSQNFGVYGYVIPVTDITNGGYIMKNAEYTPSGVSAGQPHYWPKADNVQDLDVVFTGIYPYNSNTTLDADSLVYSIKADTTSYDGSTDVLYARTKVHPQIEDVPLNFKHVLSWIQFKARYDSTSVVSAVITSIKFSSNLYTTGELVINTKDTTSVPRIRNIANGIDFQLSSGSDTLTTRYNDFQSDAIIVPQAVPDSVTITFNLVIKSADGTIYYNGRQVTRAINTGNDANSNAYVPTFEGGHKYTYRVFVCADRIDFDVTVDNWDDDVFQVWDHDATAYVEHFFDKALIIPADLVATMEVNSLIA